jgi:uncharacterized damage-inducible protein DinB
MATAVRWFERVFPGGYPVELFPSLLSRLRGAIARQRAEGEETPVAVRATPFDGTWSVQRNLAHLGDLEPLWLRRVEELERGVEVLAAADLTNGRTEEREHDRRELEDVLREFAEARRGLVERVAGWSAEQLERSALHPRLRQPMRAIDLCLFVAEHDDHHLARVAELRAAFAKRAR